jgi:hypothetical protein
MNAILSLMYPLLLLSCLDDDDLLRDAYHALGVGVWVAYIVLRDNPSPYDQTDLNKWFRLTLRDGGGTFPKQGLIGARGAIGLLTGPIDLGWAQAGLRLRVWASCPF